VEGGTVSRLRFKPNAAAVTLDDALTHGEADAGALIFVTGVEPLEDDEDPLGVFRVDANAVVANREEPISVLFLDSHVYLGPPLAGELNRVTNKVLEELLHLAGVRGERWHGVVGDNRVGFLDG